MQGLVFAALLEHWRLARPEVVAHDFGGCTALRAQLLPACEYRSLTPIDPCRESAVRAADAERQISRRRTAIQTRFTSACSAPLIYKRQIDAVRPDTHQHELDEPGRSARWRTIRTVAAVAQWQSSRLVSGRSSVRSRPAAPTWQKLCALCRFCKRPRG